MSWNIRLSDIIKHAVFRQTTLNIPQFTTNGEFAFPELIKNTDQRFGTSRMFQIVNVYALKNRGFFLQISKGMVHHYVHTTIFYKIYVPPLFLHGASKVKKHTETAEISYKPAQFLAKNQRQTSRMDGNHSGNERLAQTTNLLALVLVFTFLSLALKSCSSKLHSFCTKKFSLMVLNKQDCFGSYIPASSFNVSLNKVVYVYSINVH